MECMKANAMRKLEWEQCHMVRSNVALDRSLMGSRRLDFLHHASTNSRQHCNFTGLLYPMHQPFWRHPSWRTFSAPVSLDEEPPSVAHGDHLSNTSELVSKDAPEKPPTQQLDSNELKSLLSDSERTKLIRKLSEANQHNRFLKRQLQIKDNALVDFKSELAVLELEFQALVSLAEEVANSGVTVNPRKINGKYIQSHLLSRLEAVHEKLKEQIKDVDAISFKEVTLSWVGMAESVQVMGSFDGWSRGEEMSPEYTGVYARFSTTLKLRPGRYEIKFVVDGVWQLSPEFPTVGVDLIENNLLVVE